MAIVTSIQEEIHPQSSSRSPLSVKSKPLHIDLEYEVGCNGVRVFSMEEVRRHNSAESAWLVVGDKIYDATEYIRIHPGGEMSILRKSGGVVDCTQDFHFHSKAGKKVWDRYYVGKLKPAPGSAADRQWWQFWM
ncbi:unnamed protein product [Cylindrotheca closterium]|uniref:Cytochrome b5 heme-binding domain-containing protein n=1 Tax=Cylindrotheca closterium TaxID=2856 RepID=A0AAD2FU87_9STRA|nr:unnamed protein product [Cylindrotheca closterium]